MFGSSDPSDTSHKSGGYRTSANINANKTVDIESNSGNKYSRSAEKHRESTCSFADQVATVSIAKWKQLVGIDDDKHAADQTVIASIIAVYDKFGDEKTLEVLSLGAGTKFMRTEHIEQDSNGFCVHDSHAETLARRAFLRVLIAEVEKVAASPGKVSSRLVEKISKYQFCLRNGVSLHFYVSSSPCGNATVRRWGSCPREKPHHGFSEKKSLQWPIIPHERIDVAQRNEGQIAACVKREVRATGLVSSRSLDVEGVDIETVKASANRTKKNKKSLPCFALGTAEYNSGNGRVLSCSDKIALWNASGLQGTLLSNILFPIFLTTITVGRKFSRKHLHRALCCRLQELSNGDSGYLSNGSKIGFALPPLNHPTILCTGVKLNCGAIEQTTIANFSNVRCISWCALDGDSFEEIDGDTGLLTSTQRKAKICPDEIFQSFKRVWSLLLCEDFTSKASLMTMLDKEKCLTETAKACKLRKKQSMEIMTSRTIPSFVCRRKKKNTIVEKLI